MPQNQTIADLFDSPQEFQDFLESALDKVRGGWEHDFCEGLRERFARWGMGMFLSDAQYNKLKGIVDRRG